MDALTVNFEQQDFYRSGRAKFANGWHQIPSDPEVLFATGQPEGADQAMLDAFVAKEGFYYQLVSEYLKEHYPALLERSEFLDVFDEDDPVYPSDFGDLTEEIMLKSDVFSLIRLTSIIVLPPENNAIGFCFECAWDEEHGLGIVIYNDEVIWCDGEQQACACLNFSEVLDLDRMYRADLIEQEKEREAARG